jgi:hypothetical protein
LGEHLFIQRDLAFCGRCGAPFIARRLSLC